MRFRPLQALGRYLQVRRDRADTAVLTWLAQHGPGIGWDIATGTGMSAAQAYRSIDRMEADGRLVSRWALQQMSEGVPRRRLYDIARTAAKETS